MPTHPKEPDGGAKSKARRATRRVWAFIAGAAILIGAIAGLLSIRQASTASGPPSFSGSVAGRSGASSFASFLRTHDGQVIYLNLVCNQFVLESETSHLQAGDHCLTFTESNFSASSRNADLLITFDGPADAQQAWNGPNTVTSEREEAWTWIPWKGDSGVNASLSNGNFGAGYEVVKGYYEVVLGSGGSGPPRAQTTELLAVPPR
jgi:hypothetical protein